jgi:putative oxidoreductase
VVAPSVAEWRRPTGEGGMLTTLERNLKAQSDNALLIARVLIGILFVMAAYNKIAGYSGSVGYFTKLGIPAPSIMVPLTILFEAAAGVLLIVGFKTRLVALAIALFCILSALLAHMDLGNANQLNHFLKNFAIAGGCLALMAAGPGRISKDGKDGWLG